MKKYSFTTNPTETLRLVIDSIYTDTNTFLRELVANASDALSKMRFYNLTEKQEADDADFKIIITLDKKEQIITIEDNGIGMNQEDLINNLGKIAESGSKQFLESLKENKDKDTIIGQFGVGFYSVFYDCRHSNN